MNRLKRLWSNLVNTYVVTAHPERMSFNFALADAAEDLFRTAGFDVRRTDLYQDGFSPVAGQGDFVGFPQTEPLRLQDAQRDASKYGGFVPPLAAQQEAVRWAELLFLQFPLWWGTYPAMLKGWIERVLSYGFAYGRTRTLPPKEVVLSVTTGSADSGTEAEEYRERLDKMADDVFGYMGWTVHAPILTHGPHRCTPEQRQQMLATYPDRLRALLPSL